MIARLRSASARLATVVAPPGYGKTTLLARWAEVDPRQFAWVTLDGRDDRDAAMFLRYIAAAMFTVGVMAPEVFEALSGPAASAWPRSVPPVGAALAGAEQPLVLVLDDLHALANPSCLDVLAALVGYVPAGSQIVVTSREEPALPLGRWRAQGWVEEIGVADLRLDEQEAGSLLEAAGVELEAHDLSELNEHTEGWPAGLYLAALSLQAGGAGPTDCGGLRRRRPFRFRLLPFRDPVPAAVRRCALPHAHVGPGLDVRGSLRCRSGVDGVCAYARSACTHERIRHSPRPAGRVVSLPPPVR